MTTATDSVPAGSDTVRRVMAEGPLSLSEVAARLGAYRRGRPIHPATVTRWIITGVKLAGGATLRQEAVRMGGRTVTSWESVMRFLERQQADPSSAAAAPRTPRERDTASAAAARVLEANGC